MTALRRGEVRDELIERAGMDGPTFNTCVVRATDAGPRIHITGGAFDPKWGDCIAIGFMEEGQHMWRYAHFSPARARIIAMHLLRIAAMKERQQPFKIDKDDKVSIRNQQSGSK